MSPATIILRRSRRIASPPPQSITERDRRSLSDHQKTWPHSPGKRARDPHSVPVAEAIARLLCFPSKQSVALVTVQPSPVLPVPDTQGMLAGAGITLQHQRGA